MNKRQIVLKLVPDIRDSINNRNKIFSKYREIQIDIRTGNKIHFDFEDIDTHHLGFISLGQHRKMGNIIEGGAQINRNEYRIHTQSKQKEIFRRAILIMILIKLRNGFTFVFWTIFILILALLLSIGIDTSSGIIKGLI